MLEAEIEAYLIRRISAHGGLTAKMTIAGRRGWPDRLVILPGGGVSLVELKRSRRSAWTKPQRRMHAVLTALGADSVRLCSKEEVDAFITQRTFKYETGESPQ